MADLNFGNPTADQANTVVGKVNNNVQQQKSDPVPDKSVNDADMAFDSTQNVPTNEAGMSMEEINDPNKITVEIADYKTPLVILFGPPSCGKTMTLVRLTRYLQSKGYTVEPVSSFRPTYDRNYKDMCDNFDNMINSEDAAKSTSKINFMLVHVLSGGKPLCQILEGPGEYYFNPDDPNARFPRYVNAIINSQNRKVWAIMIEPDNTNPRMDSVARRDYANKVQRLKTRIKSRDKVLFVFNKIDETQFVISPGNVKYGLTLQHTEFLYPNIFVPFKNENPITKWFQPYNFGFVAFQTGDFSEAADGTLVFQEGDDVYPRRLWEMIRKRI